MKWPWNKTQYSNHTVKLSIGTVRFKELTNGMLNKIFIKSTADGKLNSALFLSLFENELCELSRKQINNLSIPDGDKLREAVKEILIGYDILMPVQEVKSSEEANIFAKPDKEWFDKTYIDGLNKIKAGAFNGRNR